MQKVVGSNPISRLPRLIRPVGMKPSGRFHVSGPSLGLLDSAPWRSGYAAACKAVYTGSIPVGASRSSKPDSALQSQKRRSGRSSVPPVRSGIRELADLDGRSVSNLIKIALRDRPKTSSSASITAPGGPHEEPSPAKSRPAGGADQKEE